MNQDKLDDMRKYFSVQITKRRQQTIDEIRDVRNMEIEDGTIGLAMINKPLYLEIGYFAGINNSLKYIAKENGLEFKAFEYKPVGSV